MPGTSDEDKLIEIERELDKLRVQDEDSTAENVPYGEWESDDEGSVDDDSESVVDEPLDGQE